MSKNTFTQAKPLKGNLLTGAADLSSLTLPSDAISSLLNGVVLSNVTITNSEIDNTIIGVEGSNEGIFTQLYTSGDVTFESTDGIQNLTWDPDNAILNVNGDLAVSGCSTLGNIQICVNTITAINTNGDINLVPNQLGTLFLTGPINNTVSSFGNYLTNLGNGNVTFIASEYISLTSNDSYISASSFSDQNFTTINGDFTINTDTGLIPKFITSVVENTNANVVVSTLQNSQVKVGDTVNLTGTSTLYVNNTPVDGSYIVSEVVSLNSFLISTSNILVTQATTGTLTKVPNNNVNLNASKYVTIPSNINLTFGDITSGSINNISGNTSGMLINAVGNIIISNPDSSSSIGSCVVEIPQFTKFQYGTSGSNYINFDGSSLNMNSYNNINLDGYQGFINTKYTYLVDSNPLIGNYTSGSSDLSDRGIQFKYSDTSGNNSLGWFGYKKATNEFTFYTDASNTNDVITGTLGRFNIGSISVTNISINNGGVLDMGCGTLNNVNLITGCGGTVNINSSENFNVTSGNRIALVSAGDIFIPNNIPLTLGTKGSSLYDNTLGSMVMSSGTNIKLVTQSSGSIIVPTGTKISFDNTSVGNQSIVSDTQGDLYVSTNRNFVYNMTGGNLILPENNSGFTNFTQNSMQFGTSGSQQTISGNTAGITIVTSNSYGSLNLMASSNVNISNSSGSIVISTNGDIDLFSTSGNVRMFPLQRLIFSTTNTSNSIRTNSTGSFMFYGPGTGGSSNTIGFENALNINLNVISTGSVSIPTNVFLNIGNTYLTFDTSNNLNLVNNTTNGNLNMSVTSNINASSSNLNVTNSVTNVSSQSITISGALAQINTTHVTTIDPIPSIGTYTSNSTDLTDRGIEYKWYNGSSGSTQLGWFGYKQSTGQFTYYSNAVNNNNVISGTQGQFALGSAVISNSLTFLNTGNIDMNCGTISNLNTILGCHGTVNINASSNINASATNILLSTSNLQLPLTTPISFGSTQTSIYADTNGNIIFTAFNGTGNLILNGNVQINGTTENVYSTITNIQDPVISLGGVNGPTLNDSYDRGIEFKWFNNNSNLGSTGSVIGFFGFQNTTGNFTFIPDAYKINDVYFGSVGNVQFSKGYFTNIDVACGTVSNVNTLTGCNGAVLNIVASSDVNISTSNMILPFNSELNFGNTANGISATTSGSIHISSSLNVDINATNGGIKLTTNTSGNGFVNISQNTPLNFGSGSSGSTLIQDTTGNFNVINSSGNINLTPSGLVNGTYGSISLPTNSSVVFSGTNNNNRISSDGSQLNLYGYSNVGINSSTVTISGNVNIIGSLSASSVTTEVNQYILPLGTSQICTISSITNTSTSGNILVTTLTNNYLSIGDLVTLKNTNSVPSVDGTYMIIGVTQANAFIVTGTTLTTNGSVGTIQSVLTTPQNKDVGIAVDRWSSTVGNMQITSGSLGYTTGFFGWKSNLDRWVFYDSATIANNVVTGTSFGNIQVNELYTNKIGGFILDGAISGGSFAIETSNIQCIGGSIDGTPIGTNTAQTGRFTTLSSSISTGLTNVTLQSTLQYSIERYTLSSLIPTRNPNTSIINSYVSVSGATFNAYGTMGSSSIGDGQVKKIVMSSIGPGCSYNLYFGLGKLITPNPLNSTGASQILFKRSGQSCEVLWDNTLGAWILVSGSGYIL